MGRLSTYGLIQANANGWSHAGSWAPMVVSPLLLAIFVLIELRTTAPMLDLALMRNRSFVGILLAGLVVTLAAFASFAYTSIWLQSVLGLSPIQAGLTGLPLSLSSFGVSAAIGRFLHGAKPGPIIGGGLLLIGLGGLVGGLLVHGDASWPQLIPGFLFIGIGVGLATPTLSSAAMAAVPLRRGGMAAGAVNTARQLGFALGIAALGSVFAARAAHVLSGSGVPAPDGVARALAGGQAKLLLAQAPDAMRRPLDDALHAASVQGVQWAFLVSGIAGIIAGLAVLLLLRPDSPGKHEPATLDATAAHRADLDQAPAPA